MANLQRMVAMNKFSSNERYAMRGVHYEIQGHLHEGGGLRIIAFNFHNAQPWWVFSCITTIYGGHYGIKPL
jgi:hypothetical protein